MTDIRRIYRKGYVITLDPPHGENVFIEYIRHVLEGGMAEDDFWALMRKENPVLPLQPLRRSIEAGVIVKAPPKTPGLELVEGGYYWIQPQPDWAWEIAKVTCAGEAPYFYPTMTEIESYYDEIFAIGPQVPQYAPDEDGHAHEGDRCPLCDETQLAEMRADNLARRADRRRTLLAEIEADPSAFVHVVEGYDNAEDRSPVIMLVSRTLEGAREYCASMEGHTDGLLEITPNRLDDRRTGEVVLYHSIVENGTRVEREGRFLRS